MLLAILLAWGSLMSSREFFPRNFEIREKKMETLLTFALVYVFVWFANFCRETVEWSGDEILNY